MRKFITLFLTLLLLSSTIVFAHPGGTDGAGGHKNHSTGEYHYHHGYSAHQHTDGVCPYDFDDKTNHDYHEKSDDNYDYYVDKEGNIHRIYTNNAIEDNPSFQKLPNETPTSVSKKNNRHKIAEYAEIVLATVIIFIAPALLGYIFKFIVKMCVFFRNLIRDKLPLIVSLCSIIVLPMCLLLVKNGVVTVESFVIEAIPKILLALIGSFLILLNIVFLNITLDTSLSEILCSFSVFGGFVIFIICNFFLNKDILKEISTILITVTITNFVNCLLKEKYGK